VRIRIFFDDSNIFYPVSVLQVQPAGSLL
jgi:hypothetical protein